MVIVATAAALICLRWHAPVHLIQSMAWPQSSTWAINRACDQYYSPGSARCPAAPPWPLRLDDPRMNCSVGHTCVLPQQSINASSMRYTNFSSHVIGRPTFLSIIHIRTPVSHSAYLLHCHCNKPPPSTSTTMFISWAPTSLDNLTVLFRLTILLLFLSRTLTGIAWFNSGN